MRNSQRKEKNDTMGSLSQSWYILMGSILMLIGCFRLPQTVRGNPEQLLLEVEIAKYCSMPISAPRLQQEKIFSTCRQFLSKVIRFDESFDSTDLSRKRKQQLLTSLAKVAIDSLEWPKNNQLLAFPGITLPKEMQCAFVPENDLIGCKDSVKHPVESSLAHRLVGYVLSKRYPLFYVQNVKQQQELLTKKIARIPFRKTKKNQLGIYISVYFWQLPYLDQLSQLLHEVGHAENFIRHVACNGRIFKWDCDVSLDSEIITYEVLIREFGIRKRLKTYQDFLMFDPKRKRRREKEKRLIYVDIEWQCRTLKDINHLPVPLPKTKDEKCYPSIRSIEKFLEI